MRREQVTTCSVPLKCRLSPTALVTAIPVATSLWRRAASKKTETGRLQTGFGGSRRWLGGRPWTNTFLVQRRLGALPLLAVRDAGLRGGWTARICPDVCSSLQGSDRAPSEEDTCGPQFTLLRGGHGVGEGRQITGKLGLTFARKAGSACHLRCPRTGSGTREKESWQNTCLDSVFAKYGSRSQCSAGNS